MSQVEDSRKWIGEMMPKIIENLGLDIDKVRYKILESDGSFIMSCIYRVCLQFENKTNGRDEELSMILKRSKEIFNESLNVDVQFHNEILFYQTYARPSDNYARCFYVEERSPNDSMIALENVNERGYYSCSYFYDPPLEYTLAAMRELGRYHGKGYAMKELQREKFFDFVAQIREVRYVKKMNNFYESSNNIMSLRAVEYLRDQGYDTAFCDKMEVFLSNSFEVLMKMVQPLEPLATLCHGDFTLNNILFKTEGDGRYRSMLIDFALVRYSTPVVDLSTYLYVSCSNEMRKDKFSEIMQAYHDALREYLLDAGVQDVERYSYNGLLDDFRRCAVFGFINMGMFLPVIFKRLNHEIILQDILDLGSLEAVRKHKCAGGDEISKILADALLELKELGCLDHVSVTRDRNSDVCNVIID